MLSPLLCLLALSTAFGQNLGSPVLRLPATAGNGTVRQAQDTVDRADEDDVRPLPPQIAEMPGVEEKMDVIHHRSQLVIARSNIVRTAIADPSVIDVVQYSPNELSIIGLDLGSTTLTIWFEGNPDPLIYLITTITDPDLEEQKRIDYGKLERKLTLLFPNSKVYLIPLSRKIIVKGQARDAEEAARILQVVRGEVINQEGSLAGPQPGGVGNIPTALQPVLGNGGFGNGFGDDNNGLASSLIVNMLEVPGEYQISLRVRIAEINRSHLRRLGVDFNYLIDGGRHAVSWVSGGLPSTLTGIFENGEVNVLVNWLASNGTAKILSEPVLTVLSGHQASFLAGGEFAVPTIVGVDGVGGQQTTFRGFGTSLIVTPMVIDRDLIRMRIVPEFSAINNDNAVGGIPGVDSRRVQTTIQLREGQTVAIAGLLSNQTNTEVTRIPFLGELPYIGAKLFNAKRATQDETELLILVTPELVRPMDAEEVPPVPGFEVTHPNDYELYHHAMTEGAPDTGVYQLAPYGRNGGYGTNVDYRLHNPAPASPLYSPLPTAPYGAGQYDANGYRNVPPGQRQPGPQPLQPVPMPQGPAGGYPQPAQPGAYPQGQPYQQQPPRRILPPAPAGSASRPYGPVTTAQPGAESGSRFGWLTSPFKKSPAEQQAIQQTRYTR
ncbi:MAG: pilus assembly protein N-terminal domain-containing protein [Planctomycetaceae bacterium]|nr:pilus assembly protein N-terminal domain-containing protein [Planctomycetaceae bacterium]